LTIPATRRWGIRPVPVDLVDRYVAEGWWTDETLGSIVASAVEQLADAPFVIHSRVRPWRGTFGEVDRKARSFASSLQGEGIRPGDVVVVQLPNWLEAAVTFWGATQLGAIVVPIVHFYGPKEVGYVLDVVRPDVVVSATRFGKIDHLATFETLLADRPTTPWFVVGADRPLPAGARPFDDLLDAEPLAAPLATDPDAPAVIGFTSGTTQNPKGVIHSHRTLGFEVRQLEELSRTGGPPSLIGTPVGHFMGMLAGLLIPLLRSQAIHLIDVWDPGEVLRIMGEEHLNLGGGATYFITSVLDHPDLSEEHLTRMPAVGMGGATVPVAVMERLTALGIKPYRSYGSTEHPSITGCTIQEPEAKRLTTDGHLLAGVELRLDEEGEISTRGPDLFLGYTDPGLTAQAFDDDGWYRTGDVGVIDDDGFLTITDRVSDIIIRGGENISAQEIEEQLLGLAAVAEVAVVSVPDDRLGEHAAAIVRAAAGTAGPSMDELRAHLAEVGLAKQKWPESLHLVEDLPRTPSGKVKKAELRHLLREGRLDG
jgi:acyl-CoA synthetase